MVGAHVWKNRLSFLKISEFWAWSYFRFKFGRRVRIWTYFTINLTLIHFFRCTPLPDQGAPYRYPTRWFYIIRFQVHCSKSWRDMRSGKSGFWTWNPKMYGFLDQNFDPSLNLKYDQLFDRSHPLSPQRFEQWSNGWSTRNRGTKLRRDRWFSIPLVERNSGPKVDLAVFPELGPEFLSTRGIKNHLNRLNLVLRLRIRCPLDHCSKRYGDTWLAYRLEPKIQKCMELSIKFWPEFEPKIRSNFWPGFGTWNPKMYGVLDQTLTQVWT